jgi:ribonuclease T1
MSELALRIAIRCGVFAAALALVFAGLVPASLAQPRAGVTAAVVALADLPPEARQVVVLNRRGGPFPSERDGIVFGNYEKPLPARERGYYREYTVPTPGLKHRGARRIVSGRGGELYYSDDHYQSFRRIRE